MALEEYKRVSDGAHLVASGTIDKLKAGSSDLLLPLDP